MERRRDDEDEGERRRREQLMIQQKKNDVRLRRRRRPSPNRTSDDHQINRNSPRKVTVSTIDNEHRYPPIILPSERLSLHMKSSALLQYTSNPSLPDRERKFPLHDDHSKTLIDSSHQKSKALKHAKSHGELYQTHLSRSLSPLQKPNRNDNEAKLREKLPGDSLQSLKFLQSQPTTTVAHDSHSADSSPTHKIPLWKRFKKLIVPTKRTKQRAEPPMKMTPSFPNEFSQPEEPAPRVTNDGHCPNSENPIKVSELRTWIQSDLFPEQRIREEYEKLPSESLHPKSVATRPENKCKNRFNAIEPYDHSRVILKSLPGDPTSDYINASYIDGSEAKTMYIAAQAPTDATLLDFLRMIWQLRIESIVMVTKLFEDGKHKSIQYWPSQGDKQVNQFQIRIDIEEKYAHYILRRFTITNHLEPSDVLVVRHWHFLSWPDHDCLSLSTPLLDFRERFRSEHNPASPVLVHCSAGVGRSGTFIALDALLQMVHCQDTLDVLQFTYRMRQNRVYMIQTVDQYVFLYRALIEGIVTMKTHISLSEWINTGKVHLDIQNHYQILEQLQSTISYSYRGAMDSINQNRNRVESILAADSSRPYLMTQVDQTTDYINAVFVNSYRRLSNYVVTQYPLPHTLIDLWRLVYDHNISIIMLLEIIPREPKNLPYWPSTIGQAIVFGPFEITLSSQKEDDFLIERILQMTYSNKDGFIADQTKTIRQFQLKDNGRLLPIVKRFLKEMRTRPEQNVILQCLNGSTWSGYFAALCNAIDKMQTEKVIDPLKSVRLLRAHRSQLIDQNQYESVFHSMLTYARHYLSAGSATRSTDNSYYVNTPGHDASAHKQTIPQI